MSSSKSCLGKADDECCKDDEHGATFRIVPHKLSIFRFCQALYLIYSISIFFCQERISRHFFRIVDLLTIQRGIRQLMKDGGRFVVNLSPEISAFSCIVLEALIDWWKLHQCKLHYQEVARRESGSILRTFIALILGKTISDLILFFLIPHIECGIFIYSSLLSDSGSGEMQIRHGSQLSDYLFYSISRVFIVVTENSP